MQMWQQWTEWGGSFQWTISSQQNRKVKTTETERQKDRERQGLFQGTDSRTGEERNPTALMKIISANCPTVDKAEPQVEREEGGTSYGSGTEKKLFSIMWIYYSKCVCLCVRDLV